MGDMDSPILVFAMVENIWVKNKEIQWSTVYVFNRNETQTMEDFWSYNRMDVEGIRDVFGSAANDYEGNKITPKTTR